MHVNEGKRKARDQDWPRHYAALLEYYKEHGTCNVAVAESYECDLPNMGDDGGNYHYNDRLGYWLQAQRRKKSGVGILKLTAEQENLLQVLVHEGEISVLYSLFR